MLANFGVSKDFWANAINMDYYLVNMSPSSVIEFNTLFQVWFGTLTDYSTLRVFGCPTYAYVNNGKLEQRANKYIFLGYSLGMNGYWLLCTDSESPGLII